MVLDGVDEIDWFTDRPDRFEGTWNLQKLFKNWDSMFSLTEPNAHVAFMINGQQKMASFEMSKPKINKSGDSLGFHIKSIGKNNGDKLTGIVSKKLDDFFVY